MEWYNEDGTAASLSPTRQLNTGTNDSQANIVVEDQLEPIPENGSLQFVTSNPNLGDSFEDERNFLLTQ